MNIAFNSCHRAIIVVVARNAFYFLLLFSVYEEKAPPFRSICNIVLCNTASNSLLQMSANEWKHRVGCWVPEEFLCWTQLVLLPFSSRLHPFTHKTLPVAESYPALLWRVQRHQAAGQAAFNAAYFLQSRSFEGRPGFCFHRRAVLIQVLSTSLLCINLFKSPSGAKYFDREQINLGDCLVFVQSLGQWVSTLGINIVENIFTLLAEGPSLSNCLPLPSHHWLGSDISTVLIPRRDPLSPCRGQ